MKKLISFFVVVLLMNLMSCSRQDSAVKPQIPDDALSAVSNVTMAKQLINYGNTHNDPIVLLAACKILKDNPPAELKAGKATGGTEEPEILSMESLNVENILADARRLAGENAAFDSLATQIELSETKGATGGPKIGEGVVASEGSMDYIIQFIGLEPAVVAIVGDGNADLDLYAFDANGNEITKDVTVGHEALVAFIPTVTSNFLIRVKNSGARSSAFVIGTN